MRRLNMRALLVAMSLLAVGAMSLGPNFTRRRVVSGVVIGLIAFDAVFLWRGLLVEQYLVWGN